MRPITALKDGVLSALAKLGLRRSAAAPAVTKRGLGPNGGSLLTSLFDDPPQIASTTPYTRPAGAPSPLAARTEWNVTPTHRVDGPTISHEQADQVLQQNWLSGLLARPTVRNALWGAGLLGGGALAYNLLKKDPEDP